LLAIRKEGPEEEMLGAVTAPVTPSVPPIVPLPEADNVPVMVVAPAPSVPPIEVLPAIVALWSVVAPPTAKVELRDVAPLTVRVELSVVAPLAASVAKLAGTPALINWVSVKLTVWLFLDGPMDCWPSTMSNGWRFVPFCWHATAFGAVVRQAGCA